MIGEPPDTGATHDTTTEPTPAATNGFAGAAGTDVTNTRPEAPDTGPTPTTLVADT